MIQGSIPSSTAPTMLVRFTQLASCLFHRVSNVVFSLWGPGLAALSVGIGACYGTPAALCVGTASFLAACALKKPPTAPSATIVPPNPSRPTAQSPTQVPAQNQPSQTLTPVSALHKTLGEHQKRQETALAKANASVALARTILEQQREAAANRAWAERNPISSST